MEFGGQSTESRIFGTGIALYIKYGGVNSCRKYIEKDIYYSRAESYIKSTFSTTLWGKNKSIQSSSKKKY